MAAPPPLAGLTNRAARRQIPLRLLGWLTLAAMGVFLFLTGVELWAPRAAVRLARWGLLPWASVRPGRPAERPEPGVPAPLVVSRRDVRLEGPQDRPLAAVSPRFDPGSPMEVLIPGESVNMGLKVAPDARRRDRLSGRGAPPVVEPAAEAAAEEARTAARPRAEAGDGLRRAVLKHRFRLALAILAATGFMMFVGSGFLASLFRPHPGRWTGKRSDL